MPSERIVALVLLVAVLISPLVSSSELVNYKYVRTVVIHAPAVSSSGVGILTNITLSIAYPGKGRVYFSALPLTELDTQAAARVAAWVAASISGASFYDYDYFVSMEASAPVVGGPSASGLMTVGFLSLFLNATIKPYATMTGMINPDGSIGPVGGIKEKLDAAKSMGFTLFLIPYGQRYYTYPVVNQTVTPFGIIRRVTYVTIDLVKYGQEIGVNVVEVKTAREAFQYLTGYSIACPKQAEIALPNVVINTVNNVTFKTLNETSSNLDQAQAMLKYISANALYYDYVARLITTARNYATNATHYSALNMNIIANSFAFRSLVYSTYALWLAQYLSGRLSFDDIVKKVNDTINEASRLFEKVQPFSLTYFGLEAFIDNLASYYDSQILLYTALNSTSLTSQLYLLAYAYSEARLLSDWMGLVESLKGGPLVNESLVSQQAMTLYSLASTTVPYAQTLSSEAGVSVDSLTLASDYYAAAQQALNYNDTLALIGLSIYASAYSSLALHQMFSQGQAITRDLVKTVGDEAFCLLASTNFSSIMAQIYYEYGLEALNASSLDEALAAFSMSILYSQAVEQVGARAPSHISPFTETPVPLTTTTVPPLQTTATGGVTQTPVSPRMPLATAVIISVIALVSLVIGIILLLKGTRYPR
ncbi:S16 family serine protease [Thermogladius sp.]|uniref:S16 family serine protease n=1 Tax=Thermogladius sp. TaxID=2023064 RepID=UPI003D102B6E